ncbi:enoyl-CoA hydratase-isomerase [Desulfamplus magnetovallimortis]|uniref:Enoyl-CoA hydratase-isomerase n=1 Tax=Desulfamplus magnetovallimortis TaxID=1246637 RepID=A0A1W1HBY6_9BACT|nr:enoyl-CoA hydratase-isomerase [Desulfamplus magnetovallimortis]
MENLIFDIDNGIAILTFNRPKALNALNQALLEEFDSVLDQVETNPDIRVLILTGSGEKAFVAGADISELAKMNPLLAKRFATKGQKLFSRLEALPIPVIAAVNGFALGGGTEVSLACDFIYASEKAVFGLPEITLGLIPGFGGTQRLTRLVGTNLARELIFTGKTFSAADALSYGIVNKVCEDGTLMEEVMKTAKAIAKKGSASLRAAKEAIACGKDVDLETGCRFEADAFALCVASSDAAEGTSAFLEKRKAQFKGTLDS